MSPDLVKRARRERWARDVAFAQRNAAREVWFWCRHPWLSLVYYGWLPMPRSWKGRFRV